MSAATDAAAIVIDAHTRAGLKIFDAGPYDLNLFGVRVNASTNRFDDLIGCLYRPPNGQLIAEVWRGTTDPGRSYLIDPLNPRGTGAIAEGRHPGVWRLGLHKGKDPAFVQDGAFRVYRDGDKDETLELYPSAIERSVGDGFNFHKMGSGDNARAVNKWSAGCQGTERPEDHDRALALAALQIEHHPTWKTFTYTLFDIEKYPGLRALFQYAPA